MKRTFRVALLTVAITMLATIAPLNAFANELTNGANPEPPELNGEIIVDGQLLQSPAPYLASDTGSAMIPLRAVVEALDLNVEWRPSDQSAVINGGAQIRIGDTRTNLSFVSLGNLETSPELVGGNTFVPMSFFNLTLNGFSAKIVDGSVVIDTLPYFVYRERDNIAFSSFGDRAEDESLGFDISTSYIMVGNDETMGQIFSLLRLPFGADLMANEITAAELRMSVSEGAPPSSLRIGYVTQFWAVQSTTLTDVKEIIDYESIVSVAVENNDGWISVDVTEFVKTWMAGDRQNNGFVILPEEGEPNVSFISGNTPALEVPYITISGTVGQRATDHGAFGFTRIPLEGLTNVKYESDANCLAYALRDNNPINLEQLGYDYEDLDKANIEGGQDAVLEFMAKAIEKYVWDNGAALQITAFRRIDSFDSEITPHEYRIALRVGVHVPEGMSLNMRNFDYHLWAQIDDGRWSQKFTGSYSEIIPGTAHDLDPATHPWNASRQWLDVNRHDFYESPAIYFAVTKAVAEITNHLQ